MSKFTKEMIDNYADKLLIGLTEEENETVLNEFEIIEARMNLINEIEGLSEIFKYGISDVIDSKNIKNQK